VREGETVFPLRTAEVQYLEADDDSVIIHSAGRKFRLNITLNDLEGRLDPASFVRIHRSVVVNLDQVTRIVPIPGSRFELQLRDGTRLESSRQRSRLLRGRGL
jgi:two-component system LytT family response regulator